MASYNAGIVTAYGAAVRGGYTGTYEQFCSQQANYAQTAADVEQAKQDAQAAVQQAQDIADSIPEDYTELTEEVGNLKEDFHSYHSELGAGYADQIVSGIVNTDQTPYNFRKVPYDATLEKVEGIVGVDVVLNQLCNGASVTVPNGHKYYMLKGGTASVGASTGTAITGLTSGTDMVFDLTQTFGTAIADYVYSLEQSTAGAGVAWLKKHFPKIFDSGYIAYNAGTMVHVSGLSAHKTVGKNLNPNKGVDYSTYTSEKFFVKAGQYVLSTDNGAVVSDSTAIYIQLQDKSGNIITKGGITSSGFVLNGTEIFYYGGVGASSRSFTLNFDAYMLLGFNNLVPTNFNALQLEFGSTATTYEPYTEHTYPLDSTIDLHGILKLDSNNNLYADGDVYPPSGQVQHRYGIIDLGTLIWHGFTQYANTFYADAPTKGLTANVICSKYPNGGTFTDYSTLQDKMLYNSIYLGRVAVKDTAYSTVEEITSAMSGVLLVYEKQTASTEQAEPYNPNQICDPNGTEEFISTTVAPVGHVTKYPLDVAGRLDNILSMPSANGTYTLRAVVSNGKVTYSWVSA